MGLAAEDTTSNTSLPPMLAAYLDYKSKYPDCLLLCQVGDFYEVFFEDAITVSKTLNLTLTSRDKHSPQPIPMCGVPIAVVDGYLNRLVAAGFSVAVVSQRGTAEGVKGMVPRFLERIVTPGVQVLGDAAAGGDPRVGAIVAQNGSFALAFTNVTSGVIFVREDLSRDDLLADVSRAGVNEVVVPAIVDSVKMDRRIGWVRTLSAMLGERGVKFRSMSGSSAGDSGLSALIGAASVSALGKRAASFLKEYVDETTAQRNAPFERLQVYSWDQQLALDAATRRTLELTNNASDGSERNTLYSTINLTQTPGGARLLRRWMLAPSRSLADITERQSRTEALLCDEVTQGVLHAALRQVADIERIATRIALQAVTPRELAALRDSLISSHQIGLALAACPAFAGLAQRCGQGIELGSWLAEWLMDQPAPVIGEGGMVIAEGKDEVLDRARALERDGHGLLAKLESSERTRTGVATLKIKFNNQLGYYFEVTKAHAEKLPSDFQRRQSTTSGERFFSQELKSLEQELFSASGKARTRELELFGALVTQLLPRVTQLRDSGQAVSEVDVFVCFARLARERGWVKPELIDDSMDLVVEAGRHPVLEQILAEKFIPNGVTFSQDRCALLVTGPNMGGKSTFLRQIAHLTILAQIGSFVPARRMRLGIVDGVFARLGASDNLAEGDSTFMVEMREAALICSAAGKHSLVVIDEIGRGTATADGRALAQAILEWLVVQVNCRVLFATHFHELTDLPQLYSKMANVSVGSVERDGIVHFTHEIVSGPANRSYGIEVAGHAGLPTALLARARELLAVHDAEKRTGSSHGDRSQRQLSIFDAVSSAALSPPPGRHVSPQHAKLAARVKSVVLNETTPMQALGVLDELQRILHE